MSKSKKKRTEEEQGGTPSVLEVPASPSTEPAPEPVPEPADVSEESVKVTEVPAPVPSIPVAKPNEGVTRTTSGVALKSTRKFLGGRWWTLQVGVTLTGPKEVIDALRNGGFLK